MSIAPTPPAGRSGGSSAWASGGTMFAGVLMSVSGVFAIFEGIAAIAKDDVFYTRFGAYVFKFNLNAWGWIHLIIGILLLATGLALLNGGMAWARYVGIGLASLAAIAHFLWVPYQPLWSLIAIAIDVFVIWALCTYRDTAGRDTAGT